MSQSRLARTLRLARVRERAREIWNDPARRTTFGLHLLAIAVMAFLAGRVLRPMFADLRTYGFHDWDVETAYRYITVLSLKRYGEGPWWHPYLCGGFPAFGHIEGATNLVSPYLPVYLLADVRVAIRLEVLGGAITSLLGTYLLAGRFTKSVGLRVLVAVLYALNGRWALQAATGHTWHLQYGFLPWAFLFYERSQERGRFHESIYAGAILALVVFLGGIYPLPQAALILSLYAIILAIGTRGFRPITTLAVMGVTAIGFGAPKLFAIVDAMTRAPRLIESKEVIGIAELLVMMTDPKQAYGTFPVRVPAYGWHEWGIYVGIPGVAVLVIGLLFGRTTRENALRLIGLLLLLLGFGAFHENAPWALLHKLPVFASQHVPSRFHYPMVLVLGLAFVSFASRYVDRVLVNRRWLDVPLLGVALLCGLDVTRVSQRPFGQAFWMEAPDRIEGPKIFEHRTNPPFYYKKSDWAGPILLSMMANTGVIRCYGIPDFDGVGAKAADAPGYRGRAWLPFDSGSAEVVRWSPNHATVEVKGAQPGALVVYNMNWDPSWRADGKPAAEHDHLVATHLAPGQTRVEFRYFPRTFRGSVPLFFLTLALSIGVPWLLRRRRRRRDPEPPKDPEPPQDPEPEEPSKADSEPPPTP